MKPHILMIVSDQHRLDCLGHAQRYPVATPNLDRLAREGAWFESAFTPIPLCTPARQSLLTGQRAERLGNHWNYDLGPIVPGLDPTTYSWPRELRAGGWATKYFGKWHVNPDEGPTAFGYDSWTSLEDYAAWRADRYPQWPISEDWFGNIDPVPVQDSRTHWFAAQTVDYINEQVSAGNRWHARLDFLEPHLPCQPTKEFADRYSVSDIPEWDDFADPLIDKPYIQRQQLVNWRVEDWSWDDWAPIVARYYAVVTQMDDAIGRIFDSLDELGIADETLVVYTTDHGDMNGSHRMMDKHYVMYDDVVRVPLIMRLPGRIPAGPVEGFTYNTLDLVPTIARLTGIDGPEIAHGAAIFEGSDDQVLDESTALADREGVVSTYNGQQFGLYSQRMYRSRTWKYVWNLTDVDELYDLESDPNEFVNRVDDPTLEPVLSDLRMRLLHELEAAGDRLVQNDWMRDQLRTGRKLGPTRAVLA